jgi:hypothetical protein
MRPDAGRPYQELHAPFFYIVLAMFGERFKDRHHDIDSARSN